MLIYPVQYAQTRIHYADLVLLFFVCVSCTMQGLDPTILQRLATEWSISYHTITLTPRAAEAEEDLVADQDVALFNNPLALQNALQQIATMQLPPNTTVKLEGWVVAAGVAAAVAAAPPALTRFALNLDLPESVLTDTLLGGLLAMGPRVVRAQLSHTELRTDEHADKPWPWEELLCQGVSVTQVGVCVCMFVCVCACVCG